jgi:peptidoglycan/LPS O-acetylase OafA/YrhL
MNAMKRKIPVINGLRGVAILSIVFHHSFQSFFNYGISNGRPLNFLMLIASSLWMAVDLFFFLSGFVLYLPYASGERKIESGEETMSFYFHRAKRLLPAFYIATFVTIAFYVHRQSSGAENILRIIGIATFAYPFSGSSFFPIENSPLWSIGVEAWFSVLFPLCVIAVRRIGIWKVVALSIVVSLAFRTYGAIYIDMGQRSELNYISDSLGGRLDEFAFGMLAAHIYCRSIFVKWRPIQLSAGLSLIVLTFMLQAAICIGKVPYESMIFVKLPLDFGLLLFVNATMTRDGPLSAILSIWPLQMAGMMCYSVYLWHIPVLRDHAPQNSSWGTYCLYLVLLCVISWLSYRYVEFSGVKSWRMLLPTLHQTDVGPNRPMAQE